MDDDFIRMLVMDESFIDFPVLKVRFWQFRLFHLRPDCKYTPTDHLRIQKKLCRGLFFTREKSKSILTDIKNAVLITWNTCSMDNFIRMLVLGESFIDFSVLKVTFWQFKLPHLRPDFNYTPACHHGMQKKLFCGMCYTREGGQSVLGKILAS